MNGLTGVIPAVSTEEALVWIFENLNVAEIGVGIAGMGGVATTILTRSGFTSEAPDSVIEWTGCTKVFTAAHIASGAERLGLDLTEKSHRPELRSPGPSLLELLSHKSGNLNGAPHPVVQPAGQVHAYENDNYRMAASLVSKCLAERYGPRRVMVGRGNWMLDQMTREVFSRGDPALGGQATLGTVTRWLSNGLDAWTSNAPSWNYLWPTSATLHGEAMASGLFQMHCGWYSRELNDGSVLFQHGGGGRDAGTLILACPQRAAGFALYARGGDAGTAKLRLAMFLIDRHWASPPVRRCFVDLENNGVDYYGSYGLGTHELIEIVGGKEPSESLQFILHSRTTGQVLETGEMKAYERDRFVESTGPMNFTAVGMEYGNEFLRRPLGEVEAMRFRCQVAPRIKEEER